MHKVLFILNYDSKIGFGHLSRCSVIAECYKKNSHSPHLLTRKCSSSENEKLNSFDFVHLYDEESFLHDLVKLIKNFNFSTIIVDDYSINHSEILKNIKENVTVLRFDLNPFKRDNFSTIINYNPSYKIEDDLNHLLGPNFILIDEKFKNLKEKRKSDEVFIFFGGGSDHSAIGKYKDYLNFLASKHSKVNIAITSMYKNKDSILKKYKDNKSFRVLLDAKSFATTLNNSMFAFISGGTITYESAFLNIPMQIVTVAKNQIKQSEAWDNNNNARYVGDIESVDSLMLKNSYEKFFSNRDLINKWFKYRKINVDGLGAERIMNYTIK